MLFRSLEMGGKNAIVVLDDANIDLAVEGAVWGAFGTTGQRCTAASRMIVQKGAYSEFVSKFVDRSNKLRVGDGLDESNDMGPQINQQQIETSEKYVAIGKGEGAKVLAGGSRNTSGRNASGWFFEPTIFGEDRKSTRLNSSHIQKSRMPSSA